jgi:hypothetical protein
MSSISYRLRQPWGTGLVWLLAGMLILLSASQDYDLVFNQYANGFKGGSWNTSQLGAVIRNFADTVGAEDSAWVVPYPHWVDTRLVGINAGYPARDYALWPDNLPDTISDSRTKMFLVKPEDESTVDILHELYPQGVLSRYDAAIEGKDFLIYFVPQSIEDNQ